MENTRSSIRWHGGVPIPGLLKLRADRVFVEVSVFTEFFPKIFGWKNILGKYRKYVILGIVIIERAGIRLVQIC